MFKSQGAQPSAIKAIRIQTATYGVARPIVYGATRVAINLIWYGNFKAVQQYASGGK